MTSPLPRWVALLCLLGLLSPTAVMGAETSLSLRSAPGESLLVDGLDAAAGDRILVHGARFIGTDFDSCFLTSWIPGGGVDWTASLRAGDPVWIRGMARSGAGILVGGLTLPAAGSTGTRFVLMELAPDGSLVRDVSVEAGLTHIDGARMGPLAAGASFVAIQGERTAGHPGFAALRFSPTGDLEWARWVEWSQWSMVAHVPLADGSVIVVLEDRDAFGDYRTGLVTLGPDGSLLSSRTLRSIGRQVEPFDARLAGNSDLVILGRGFPSGCPVPAGSRSAWIARIGAEDALDWLSWEGDPPMGLLGRELATREWEIVDDWGIVTTASIDLGTVSAAEHRDAGATFRFRATAERDGRLFVGGMVSPSGGMAGLLAELGTGGATSTACVTMAPLTREPFTEAFVLEPLATSCTPIAVTLADDIATVHELDAWATPLCPSGPRPPRRVEDLRPHVPRGRGQGLRPNW